MAKKQLVYLMKRLLKEKGERLSKELMEKMTPFIMNQKNHQFENNSTE